LKDKNIENKNVNDKNEGGVGEECKSVGEGGSSILLLSFSAVLPFGICLVFDIFIFRY
jgi:hypothetical protein